MKTGHQKVASKINRMNWRNLTPTQRKILRCEYRYARRDHIIDANLDPIEAKKRIALLVFGYFILRNYKTENYCEW